jgi:hypothetical protein
MRLLSPAFPICIKPKGVMSDTIKSRPQIGHKVVGELKRLFQIFLYMLICVGAILYFRMSIPSKENIGLWHFGYAIVKALLLAKFILLGHMLHIGERLRGRPLFYSSLYQALALCLLLIVLLGLEEGVVALVQGQTIRASIGAVLGSSRHLILAQGLLMFLLLLPYVAFLQLNEALGAGNLKRLFFASRSLQDTEHVTLKG